MRAAGPDLVRRLRVRLSPVGRGLLAIVILVLSLGAAAAATPPQEKRVALVIGIADYKYAPHLANPVNDARDIGEALRRLNFQVIELFNPDYLQFSHGLREFGLQAASADAALVYYAGHGVQVSHENYLLPTDAKLERERDLLYEALPLDLMLGEVAQARKIGIVLLDACRNNPFVDRMTRSFTLAGRGINTTAGLARVDNVPRNTVVVMATRADSVSDDGDDGHSPFADALLAHFQIPGLELGLFFRSVRDTVLKATNNRQEPYIFSSLGAEPFYFNPRPPNRPPELAPVAALQVLDNAGPTPLGIPRPTDPDGDTLSIRITRLPRSGEVRIDNRAVAPNEVFSVEAFARATYKPDGKTLGPVGTVDILVDDGRGGNVMGSLPITVLTSNHPPVVDAVKTVQAHPVPLGIASPTDPDGDKLTVTVTGLPLGAVRKGAAVLKLGDRLTPAELAQLTFLPDPGGVGPAGSFTYVADDGRGGRAEGRVDLVTADTPTAPAQDADAAVWSRIQAKGEAGDIESFLRLFPDSRLTAEARKRLTALAKTAGSAAASPAATPAPSVAPAPEGGPSQRIETAALSGTPGIALPQAAGAAASPRTMPPASAGEAAAAKPGPSGDRTFRDCENCPVMVRVPGGSFTMGQDARDPTAAPAHQVAMHAFAVGAFPVTVGEWKACLAAGACDFMPRMYQADDRTPVHNLSWDDTQQYVAWLSRRSGRKYRLPTEAEWEYAARAGTKTRYWWGNEAGIALANCADCGGSQDLRRPLPAGAFSANPFGLYDMLGGVAQWVADCWFPSYAGAPADGAARDAKGCLKRVLRGGSFRSHHDDIAASARGSYDASVRYITNGFRVARDLD